MPEIGTVPWASAADHVAGTGPRQICFGAVDGGDDGGATAAGEAVCCATDTEAVVEQLALLHPRNPSRMTNAGLLDVTKCNTTLQ